MNAPPVTLDRFILEEQQSFPGATGELSLLLMRFGVAGKRIADALARAGLTQQLGAAGHQNVQGEEQKKLDVLANEILLETFDYGGLVALAASEEMDEPFVYRSGAQGRYSVLFDPMDGSSNIDVNGTLGLIFSVRPRRDGDAGGFVALGPRTSRRRIRPLRPRGSAGLHLRRRRRTSSRWSRRSASFF